MPNSGIGFCNGLRLLFAAGAFCLYIYDAFNKNSVFRKSFHFFCLNEQVSLEKVKSALYNTQENLWFQEKINYE